MRNWHGAKKWQPRHVVHASEKKIRFQFLFSYFCWLWFGFFKSCGRLLISPRECVHMRESLFSSRYFGIARSKFVRRALSRRQNTSANKFIVYFRIRFYDLCLVPHQEQLLRDEIRSCARMLNAHTSATEPYAVCPLTATILAWGGRNDRVELWFHKHISRLNERFYCLYRSANCTTENIPSKTRRNLFTKIEEIRLFYNGSSRLDIRSDVVLFGAFPSDLSTDTFSLNSNYCPTGQRNEGRRVSIANRSASPSNQRFHCPKVIASRDASGRAQHVSGWSQVRLHFSEEKVTDFNCKSSEAIWMNTKSICSQGEAERVLGLYESFEQRSEAIKSLHAEVEHLENFFRQPANAIPKNIIEKRAELERIRSNCSKNHCSSIRLISNCYELAVSCNFRYFLDPLTNRLFFLSLSEDNYVAVRWKRPEMPVGQQPLVV